MIFWNKETNIALKPIVLFTEWLQRKYINSDGVESLYIKYEYIIIPSVITILLFLCHINYNEDTTSIMLMEFFVFYIDIIILDMIIIIYKLYLMDYLFLYNLHY